MQIGNNSFIPCRSSSFLFMVYIFPNIAVGVKASRQERGHKRDFLGAKQLKLMLSTIERDSLKGKRNYAIMTLMCVGGLRTIEVIRANVEDMRRLGDFTVL